MLPNSIVLKVDPPVTFYAFAHDRADFRARVAAARLDDIRLMRLFSVLLAGYLLSGRRRGPGVIDFARCELGFRDTGKLRLGLTGGIGSGKTQVANLLAGWGATVIDTDLIAHALTAPGGAAIEPIRAEFGPLVIDATGALDRAAMREKVFADPGQRRRLEAILHPLIGDEVARQAARAQGLYVVFVVPLLVESGRWLDRIDRLCVVDFDEATQIARVGNRSGIPPQTVQRILAAQATRAERLALADDVVLNDVTTSIEDLERQVLVLHKAWCNLAGSVSKPSAVHSFGIGQQ